MAFFRIKKSVIEGLAALEDVSVRPKKKGEARKAPYEIRDDILVVPSGKFPTEFDKIRTYATKKGITEILIEDSRFDVTFKVGGTHERGQPEIHIDHVRARGIAASLGAHARVAVVGFRGLLYGHLEKAGELSADLNQHATNKPDADRVITFKFIEMQDVPPLDAGQIRPSELASSYLLYAVLRQLPTTGDTKVVCHQYGPKPVEGYKIWRPDAPIAVHGSVTAASVRNSIFAGPPAHLVIKINNSNNKDEITAIITAPDFVLPPDQVVAATPYTHPVLDTVVSLAALRSSNDVLLRAGFLGGLKDHWDVTATGGPVAQFYREDSGIKTYGRTNIHDIRTQQRFNPLHVMFERAGGPLLITPHPRELNQSSPDQHLAIFTPPDYKAA